MRIKIIPIVILLSASVTAQSPSPCSVSDLRASLAESQLAAARLETQTGTARIASMEKDLAVQRGQLSASEGRVAVEKDNSAKLTASNDTAQQRIAELETQLVARDKTIAEGIAIRKLQSEEIARLARAINKANRTAACRILRIGCIK